MQASTRFVFVGLKDGGKIFETKAASIFDAQRVALYEMICARAKSGNKFCKLGCVTSCYGACARKLYLLYARRKRK